MQATEAATEAAIDHLVATTFAALADALDAATLAGAPLARTRAVDRAIEALAGYALGAFAAGVAARLASRADLAHGAAIRTALVRATSAAQLSPAPVAIDIEDDHARVVQPRDLRVSVAVRLLDSRGDAARIVAALVAASDDFDAQRIVEELADSDDTATRFRDQIERVWALLHGGTTCVAAPKAAPPAYAAIR